MPKTRELKNACFWHCPGDQLLYCRLASTAMNCLNIYLTSISQNCWQFSQNKNVARCCETLIWVNATKTVVAAEEMLQPGFEKFLFVLFFSFSNNLFHKKHKKQQKLPHRYIQNHTAWKWATFVYFFRLFMAHIARTSHHAILLPVIKRKYKFNVLVQNFNALSHWFYSSINESKR